MPNPALTEAVYYILLSLMQPLYGYGIMQNVQQMSGGRVTLAAGTLYGAINTLLKKGWINALPGAKDSLYFFRYLLTNNTMCGIVLYEGRHSMDIQLKRGLLEICVLAAIKNEDSYGYQIIKDMKPYIEISESTLYPILRRLETAECLTVRSVEHNGRLRKYYHITENGLK